MRCCTVVCVDRILGRVVLEGVAVVPRNLAARVPRQFPARRYEVTLVEPVIAGGYRSVPGLCFTAAELHAALSLDPARRVFCDVCGEDDEHCPDLQCALAATLLDCGLPS